MSTSRAQSQRWTWDELIETYPLLLDKSVNNVLGETNPRFQKAYPNSRDANLFADWLAQPANWRRFWMSYRNEGYELPDFYLDPPTKDSPPTMPIYLTPSREKDRRHPTQPTVLSVVGKSGTQALEPDPTRPPASLPVQQKTIIVTGSPEVRILINHPFFKTVFGMRVLLGVYLVLTIADWLTNAASLSPDKELAKADLFRLITGGILVFTETYLLLAIHYLKDLFRSMERTNWYQIPMEHIPRTMWLCFMVVVCVLAAGYDFLATCDPIARQIIAGADGDQFTIRGGYILSLLGGVMTTLGSGMLFRQIEICMNLGRKPAEPEEPAEPKEG